MISFRSITAEQTLALRQSVLWPDRSLQDVMLSEDATALHYGAFSGDAHVAVASVFIAESSARLRKFAIDPAHQRQGIGSDMVEHIIRDLSGGNVDTLWCDARETALPFYRALGFSIEGTQFFKSGVAYFVAKIPL